MSFPAPSDHTIDTNLNLNHLVKNPPATFFFRVSGDDMAADCLHSGDLLIVDRSLDPVQGCLVVAALEGELVVRRVHQREGQYKLKQPGSESDHSGAYEVWGVVTTVIHSVWSGLSCSTILLFLRLQNVARLQRWCDGWQTSPSSLYVVKDMSLAGWQCPD